MDRLNNAIKRSLSRASHFKQSFPQSRNTIQSQIIAASGEYLMKLSIGTPPVKTLGIADTGSDLTWMQCEPLSPTVIQSYSMGTLAAETFTLGSTSGQEVSIPKMVFGCGHDNEGTFNETATGIIGLGGGSVSLVSQLSDVINGKFSYCLLGFNVNDTVTSKINFGDNAVVSGSGVVSTPIVPNDISTFYYLTLESITVGKKTLKYETKMKYSSSDNAAAAQEGNIIIDSGTTLTLLPGELYGKLESELRKNIKARPSDDPQGLLGLCYGDNNIDLPKMTFKFTGAELELPPTNTFVQNGKLVCLAMVPSDEIAIFGNLSQMNLLIGYDLLKKQLSFKQTDCSNNN
ncbi:aspartic proteinase CDR1-like [Actinidia eriantha]|uniref:aspartic proteinase CDR1-like n=1 Tax=Actinidia eriantha TaxID=165200 RepID=UPI00258DF7CC|nr:aspartic proteinase CDR1-like [Actinidia eriantha]